MPNSQEARVELTKTQLKKLKSAAKNKTGTTLRLNKINFEDEELFVTTSKYIIMKIFHFIVNTNSIVQHAIKNKNGIIKHVNVNVKIITSAKKIIFGILAHAFVRIVSIWKVFLILQWLSMMKS